MTTSTNSRAIDMGVSDAILTKAPRFFGSSKSILTELFQNSYRAGAENIRITWNPVTRILEFTDDGLGCDPEDLVVVGDSSWDETSPAIDPAGIGVFSILRPEYCEQVTYRSKNWEMTISPENLETAQAEVTYLEEEILGMTISIILTEKADFAKEHFVQKVRGRYPINVTWQELPKDVTTVKAETILDAAHWIMLDVEGIGKLEIGKRHSFSSTQHFVVWQHAIIDSGALRDALLNASQKHSRLAHRIFQYINCILDVDSISGIRPRLPDRDDVIEDAHLDSAAEKIVTDVMNYLLEPLCPDLWPDRVNGYSYPRVKTDLEPVSKVLFMEVPEDAVIRKVVSSGWGLQTEILRHFGYKEISWDEVTSYSYSTIQDDGMTIEIEWDCLRHYVRNTRVIVVGNEVLAQSLCNQGVYAEVRLRERKEKRDRIRITGRVYKPDSLVAFAKKITINGTPVQWLLNEDYDYRKRGPLFTTSLSPAEFYKAVKTGDPDCNLWVSLVIWQLYREGETYEYAELGEAEYDLRTSDIADDLCQDALAVGAPELLGRAQTKNAYENALRSLRQAARFMDEAENIFGRIEQPEEQDDVTQDIQRLTKRTRSLTRKMGRKVKSITDELDTFIDVSKEAVSQ
ncbi:MAG TPA: hypothetical protein VLA72_13920 [Anaerolineales bacterium]|nr:hypothetical protein [Anaerolineales bacterium]